MIDSYQYWKIRIQNDSNKIKLEIFTKNYLLLFCELGEIQRQLEASSAKAIIGTPKTFETLKQAVENVKKDIKIICIKTEANESIPSGAIDFADLIDTNSKYPKQIMLGVDQIELILFSSRCWFQFVASTQSSSRWFGISAIFIGNDRFTQRGYAQSQQYSCELWARWG